MAKTAGYSRSYRQGRRAIGGAPLRLAEDVRTLQSQYGYGVNKAAREAVFVDRYLRDMQRIANGDMSAVAPKGRAPKGMGDEWAARRSIDRMYRSASNSQSRAESGRSSYRGTRSGRRQDNTRQATSQLMSKFKSEARDIMRGPGSFRQKERAIRERYETARYYGSWR